MAPPSDAASETRRAMRYLLFGAMAAGINWGSRFGWSLLLPFQFAVIAAYATGMVFAFVTFRCFVFDASGAGVGGQARNFVIVNLLGAAQTWILAMVMVDKILPAIGWRFQPEACGHAVAIAAPVVTSWFGHRYFTFRAAKVAA
ncbi:MAG TPA: GtrA family protein [Caulobacteraceae bacterium]|jgi:putative flippase GtrA